MRTLACTTHVSGSLFLETQCMIVDSFVDPIKLPAKLVVGCFYSL